MVDTFTSTSTTNFDKTVVALVKKDLQAKLRAGLAYTPRGSIIPAQLVPGTNGTFRSVAYGDLDPDGAVSIEDGQADPAVEDLDVDYIEFTGTAKGRTVGVTDNARMRSPHNLASVAVDAVTRDILVSVDNVPRALYAAATPVVFAGTGNAAIADVATTDIMTADRLKDAVAYLRSRDVATLAGGVYAFTCHPFVARDLQADDDFVNEMRHSDPATFLTGEVARYAGAAIITSSRAVVKSDAGTDTAFAGTTVGEADDETFTTSVAHGLVVGDTIRFITVTGGTGFSAVGTLLFVKTAPSATTFTVALTAGGATVAYSTDITVSTWGRAKDVHVSTLIGADAAFAALGGLHVIPVTGPDKSDPLDRRDLYSWKGFLGGVLNDIQAERFINVASGASLAIA